MITSIKNTLTRSNLELAGQEITENVRPLVTDDFSEHHRNHISENLMEEIKINTCIKSLAFEKVMTSENDNKGENNG